MSYRPILRVNLIGHEDKKPKLYLDSVGKWTIGVGHNLTDNGLSDAAIEFILAEDMQIAEDSAKRLYPHFVDLDETRQAALVELAFNLGETKLRGFEHTNAAINSGDWEAAALHLEASHWYGQVGRRGKDVVKMVRGG